MSLFITFEGTEGTGKTTQIGLVEDALIRRGLSVINVREPGGTQIGDQIRAILLDPQHTQMQIRTEILLYAAARAQLVEKVIRPALQSGKIVLCDRYVDSSIAYQGYGAEWEIEEVIAINQIATGGLEPDRTYLLQLPLEWGEERIAQRGEQKDRMEQKDHSFHQRVKHGFEKLATRHQRIKVISAEDSIETVFAEIEKDLDQRLANNR